MTAYAVFPDVAETACIPLRTQAVKKNAKGQATKPVLVGGKCACCGLEARSGLEWHHRPQGAGKPVKLCPLCHMVQHLDRAGALNAGTMIWLPELPQAQINLLAVVIFLALLESREGRGPGKAVVDRLKGLYSTLEDRSKALEGYFGAKNELFDPASPAFYAQHIAVAKANGTYSAKALEGLRMLPRPQVFMAVVAKWRKELLAKYPVDSWASLCPLSEDERNSAASSSAAEIQSLAE